MNDLLNFFYYYFTSNVFWEEVIVTVIVWSIIYASRLDSLHAMIQTRQDE